MGLTCALLDRFYSALRHGYPESFFLLVEWFTHYDCDGFMLQEVQERGFREVVDLPLDHRRDRYKSLAFISYLGFEMRKVSGVDVIHYHMVDPGIMFKLRHYIRVMRSVHDFESTLSTFEMPEIYRV